MEEVIYHLRRLEETQEPHSLALSALGLVYLRQVSGLASEKVAGGGARVSYRCWKWYRAAHGHRVCKTWLRPHLD